MSHIPRRLGRLALGLLAIAVAAVIVWQGVSLLATDGQALAPITGQYYLGESWMATPTPPPASSPTATALPATPTTAPTPTPAPIATPAPAVGEAIELEPQARPTPDAFIVEVARTHGIDPAGTFVVVNQNAQRMTVVQDGLVVRTLPISTGDPDQGWYTPGWSGAIGEYWGTFSANGVTADDAWYLFQSRGSILIHSLPYTLAPDGSKQYQGINDLGVFPASRGCIRIAPDDARWFTQWGPYGVPIVVLPWDGGTKREG